MENKQAEKNLRDLNLLFETLGFDEKTKRDHLERLSTIIFVYASEKLDQMIIREKDLELPEMKSSEDFYNHYKKYINEEVISKVIEEITIKKFTEYFSAIESECC